MSKIQCAADLFQSQAKISLQSPQASEPQLGCVLGTNKDVHSGSFDWNHLSSRSYVPFTLPSQPLTNFWFSTSKREVILIVERNEPTAELNQHEEWIIWPQGRSVHLFTFQSPFYTEGCPMHARTLMAWLYFSTLIPILMVFPYFPRAIYAAFCSPWQRMISAFTPSHFLFSPTMPPPSQSPDYTSLTWR